jgi:hypothetical protein
VSERERGRERERERGGGEEGEGEERKRGREKGERNTVFDEAKEELHDSQEEDVVCLSVAGFANELKVVDNQTHIPTKLMIQQKRGLLLE